MSPVIQNRPVGGRGGEDFSLYKLKPVRELELWYGQGSGDQQQYTVLKGIRAHWDGEEPISKGTAPQEDRNDLLHTSYTFEDNERVHWMDAYGAPSESFGRADAVRFSANDHFAAGGSGGEKHSQNIGSGILYGFTGAAGADIDRLGAVFKP